MIVSCNECDNRAIFARKENKRSFRVKNSSKRYINEVRVDGCLIKSGKKCDWLYEIECQNTNEIFYVELKGKDLNHALEQILETIDYCNRVHNHNSCKKRAYIVLSRYPKEDSSIQKKKKELNKRGIKLKIATNVHEEVI